MNSAPNKGDILPPIPRPPHDPTWWPLNGEVGWREAYMDGIERAINTKALRLAILPGSGRSLTEPSGSFGGLIPPLNVAISPDGRIFLLDQTSALLKQFDPCSCFFTPIRFIGGPGSGPRQFSQPNAIVIRDGNLYVCDTGNHRVSVFSVDGWVLRDHWAPPVSVGLNHPWEPLGIAFDRRGRAYISDRANECIHRFDPGGIWHPCRDGFGDVTRIAIDDRNRLYVARADLDNALQIIDLSSEDQSTVSSPEALTGSFPKLPFSIDHQGYLNLAILCHPESLPSGSQKPQAEIDGVFDLHGNPVREVVDPPKVRFAKSGVYFSEALDSKLYRCQWHRVLLNGTIPQGGRIQVSTYTAEASLTSDQILNLAREQWEPRHTVTRIENGLWDGLVYSGGGRYLWLRLQLEGSGSDTPVLDNIRIEYPRISLRRFLPGVFSEGSVNSDFTDRFLSIFDATMRGIEAEIDGQAKYFDPSSTPAEVHGDAGIDFLSWLASWIGLKLDRRWPEEQRRRLLKTAAKRYHIRGTREGLWRQLLFFLGMDSALADSSDHQTNVCGRMAACQCKDEDAYAKGWQPPPLILEHFQLRRWLYLGGGRIGDQAMLWGKRIVNRSRLGDTARLNRSQLITTKNPMLDPFNVHAHKFSVFVPGCYKRSDRHRKGLENLLESEKPGHTAYQLEFVEPRMRIGIQSMIGFDTVVGDYPEGITVDSSRLGRATVLPHTRDLRGGLPLR